MRQREQDGRLLRRPPKSRHLKALHMVCYGHLSNTTAKRSIARSLLSDLEGFAEKHEADLITGDFKMAACLEHGKPSSRQEERGRGMGRGETPLLPPPEVVPTVGVNPRIW